MLTHTYSVEIIRLWHLCTGHSRRVTGKLFITEDLLLVFSCETGSTYISGRMVNGRTARAVP